MKENEQDTKYDALFVLQAHDTKTQAQRESEHYSYWKSVLRVFFSKRINVVLLTLLGVLLLFSFVYPILIRYDPEVDPYRNLLDGTARHLAPRAAMEKLGYSLRWCLGTGASGESTFDAVFYGASISLRLAIVAALINLTIGTAVGILWGYSRRFDAVMTEVYNVVSGVPYVLILSVIVLILSASFWSMVLGLCLTGWVSVAYFIRTQVLILRDREYNLASRTLGTPLWRIAIKNVLPHLTSVIVTLVASEIPSYISLEVFLSYIGMGLAEMSLGRLIERAQVAMVTPGWAFEFWSPVAVASLITVVLYIVGQNLADASDPRTH